MRALLCRFFFCVIIYVWIANLAFQSGSVLLGFTEEEEEEVYALVYAKATENQIATAAAEEETPTQEKKTNKQKSIQKKKKSNHIRLSLDTTDQSKSDDEEEDGYYYYDDEDEDDGDDNNNKIHYHYNEYGVPVEASSSSSSPKIKWRVPGRGAITTLRSFSEVLAYGIGGVLPWFGTRIPALRYKPPFGADTDVFIATVPNLVLVTMDMHQCSPTKKNKKNSVDEFDVCYSPETWKTTREYCFDPDQRQADTSRKREYPKPGHEKRSCSKKNDNHSQAIMEELGATMVVDYLLHHDDRIYLDRTNNLFFVEKIKKESGKPLSSLRQKEKDRKDGNNQDHLLPLISVDHHAHYEKFFRFIDYKRFAQHHQPFLQKFDLPKQFRQEISNLLHSIDDMIHTFNTTFYGDWENICHVANNDLTGKQINETFSLNDMLWQRFQSVANFYDIPRPKQPLSK